MNHLNTHTNHPIIQREQSYVLDRKLLAVHSEDRDVKKWPNSNRFEVRLPEPIKNIQSMRLINVSIPNNLYTFTNNYQNTKITFTINPSDWPTGSPHVDIENKLALEKVLTVTIDEGSYTPTEMANMMTNKLNEAVTTYLKTDHTNSFTPANSSAQVVDYTYTYFKVKYNTVTKKFIFGNRFDNFQITSKTKITYTVTDCEQKVVYNQYTKWGLPYYLGFEKADVSGVLLDDSTGQTLGQETSAWITPATDLVTSNTKMFIISAPKMASVYGEMDLYMDMERYNNLSEISPYSEATTNMYNNDYRGMIKNSFAKIPLNVDSGTMVTNSAGETLANMMTHFTNPIECLQKLSFKFRLHDGRLVDFKDTNFNFMLEFNCLLDEPAKQFNLRIPATIGF